MLNKIIFMGLIGGALLFSLKVEAMRENQEEYIIPTIFSSSFLPVKSKALAEKEEYVPITLNNLPQESQLCIFTFLEPATLFVISQVSQTLSTVAANNDLWAPYVLKELSPFIIYEDKKYVPLISQPQYKLAFRHQYLAYKVIEDIPDNEEEKLEGAKQKAFELLFLSHMYGNPHALSKISKLLRLEGKSVDEARIDRLRGALLQGGISTYTLNKDQLINIKEVVKNPERVSYLSSLEAFYFDNLEEKSLNISNALEELREKAHEKKWRWAQRLLTEALVEGHFGLSITPLHERFNELVNLGFDGYGPAQQKVCNSLFEGGNVGGNVFYKDLGQSILSTAERYKKLFYFAVQHKWEPAQAFLTQAIALGQLTQEMLSPQERLIKLQALVEEGWSSAGYWLAQTLLKGNLKQDDISIQSRFKHLEELSLKGGPGAQLSLVVALDQGILCDHLSEEERFMKLMELADKEFTEAQIRLAIIIKNGKLNQKEGPEVRYQRLLSFVQKGYRVKSILNQFKIQELQRKGMPFKRTELLQVLEE